MLKIKFTKMVASGNDFVVIDNRKQKITSRKLSWLAKQICERKHGIGADGLLVLEKSRIADVKMRIFNPDGSEPEMCGNGIRATAFYVGRKRLEIQTKAGIIEAEVNKGKSEVRVKMSQPEDIRLSFSIRINNRKMKVNFINTGVPHVVIFVEGIDEIDVVNIGRQIRNHSRFLPDGTNVDFVQIIDDNNIRLRTYERGVEDETLACGTGTVASAIIYAIYNTQYAIRKINVHTKSGEVLRVRFNGVDDKFDDIRLAGKSKIVYSGVYYA